jgi:Ca-activated chloride channel family protein
LERAKQMVSKLVDNMTNDRIGLVIFAGDAFIQLPITSDYASAKMFLNAISPELIRTQGTAIGAALDMSAAGFDAELSDAGRAIIIITDGENHEDDAIQAAQRAYESGIRVIVVGIGKPEGAFIPMPGTGDFLKDRSGERVVSKLNEEMCQQIAQAGQGLYVHCDNTNTALRTIQKELEDLGKAQFKGLVYKEYNEQFASFALPAILLLVIEFFVFSRKNKTITKLDIFGEMKEEQL